MGANHVVMSRTGGTDHVFMQAVGVPGFQFIQDPPDYSSRLHHTNVDTFDHLKAEDMRQGSIVLASLLRSEEHTSELQSLMRVSYAVFCLQTNKSSCSDDIHYKSA